MYHLNNIIQTYVRKINRENSDLDAQLVVGSLLTYALNLEAGFKNIQVGDGTTDKPVSYAGGYIIKRKINQPTIVLYDLSTGVTYSNTYDGSWKGWRYSLSNSDIEYFSAVVTVAAGATNTVAITYKNRYASIPVPVAVVGGTAVDPKYVNWTVRSRNATGCVIAITNTHPSTSIQPSIYGSVMAEK